MGFCRTEENIEADSAGIQRRFLGHEGNVLAELLNVEPGDILAVELIMIALVFYKRRTEYL